MILRKPIKNDHEEIEVSSKHLVLRTAGFAVFFVLALTFISLGVLRIGRTEPGLRSITAPNDDELPLYQLGVNFQYDFTGDNKAIKLAVEELTGVWTAIWKDSFRLLDPVNTYSTGPNLATLNQSRGEEVTVPRDLYDILRDAAEKTGRPDSPYSLFAGALHRAWEAQRFTLEPQATDPLADPDQADRLDRLTRATGDLRHFQLEFLDDDQCRVRFTVDADYLALLRELEMEDAPILDLNVLHDAYRLELSAQKLEAKGYHRGFLTGSGGSIALSGYEGGEVCLYGTTEKGPIPAATCPLTMGLRSCFLRAFALDEEEAGYYALEQNGRTYLRHPWLPADGQYRDAVLSVLVCGPGKTLPEVTYEALGILSAADADAAEALAQAALPDPAALILRDEPRVIRATADTFTPDADYGFTARLLPARPSP